MALRRRARRIELQPLFSLQHPSIIEHHLTVVKPSKQNSVIVDWVVGERSLTTCWRPNGCVKFLPLTGLPNPSATPFAPHKADNSLTVLIIDHGIVIGGRR